MPPPTTPRSPAAPDARTPHVTVVVLNFNGEAVVARCLEAVLAQDYPSFDVLLVDNASRDASLERARPFLASGRLSILALGRNVGCPEGRNVGVRYAAGEWVAFLDADGYARPGWLAAAVRAGTAAGDVGAVASWVTFARRPDILNGAGGTLNLRGYGGDHGWHEPAGRAVAPSEPLFPMGCGMVVRRDVLEELGGFDGALFNYYDDADLGVRIWASGRRVVLARDAGVDHDFGSSDSVLGTKTFLCERNRVRTVLKYFPLAHLPRWLAAEVRLGDYLLRRGHRSLPFRVWGWNLARLGSALAARRRFAAGARRFWPRLEPSWGPFPAPCPNNVAVGPRAERLGPRVVMDGARDAGRLSHGWYDPEWSAGRSWRWTAGEAALVLAAPRGARLLTMTARAATSRALEVTVRAAPAAGNGAGAGSGAAAAGVVNGAAENGAGAGSGAAAAEDVNGAAPAELHLRFPLSSAWTRRAWDVALPPGAYEVVLRSETEPDRLHRPLGAAVAQVGFA
jgi:GT2 family glycosyltransferase